MRRISALIGALSLLSPAPAGAVAPAGPTPANAADFAAAPESTADLAAPAPARTTDLAAPAAERGADFAAPALEPPVRVPAPPDFLVGGDEVRLLDGTSVRGRVVEHERGSHVVIVEPDSKPRRIDWADVAAIDLERDRPTQPPNPAAGPPDVPPPPGSVRFHIVTEGPGGAMATLYAHTVTAAAHGGRAATVGWETAVCTNPCGVLVSTGARAYHINRLGDGVYMRSRSFQLRDRTGDVTAYVRPGSRPARALGIGLLALAVGASVFGLMLLALPSGSGHADIRRTITRMGAGLMGAGAGGIAISIPVMMRGRNRVRLVSGRPR